MAETETTHAPKKECNCINSAYGFLLIGVLLGGGMFYAGRSSAIQDFRIFTDLQKELCPPPCKDEAKPEPVPKPWPKKPIGSPVGATDESE